MLMLHQFHINIICVWVMFGQYRTLLMWWYMMYNPKVMIEDYVGLKPLLEPLCTGNRFFWRQKVRTKQLK